MQNKKTQVCTCFIQTYIKCKRNYKTSYLTMLITPQIKLENVTITIDYRDTFNYLITLS